MTPEEPARLRRARDPMNREYAKPLHVPATARAAPLNAAHSPGLTPTAKIAGPSNIGNHLAGLGIPATAGSGVDYSRLHGTDERNHLDTIEHIQAAHHRAPVHPPPAEPRTA